MLLQAEQLHVGYGSSRVLEGCSIEVAAGECVALLGRNGVGKTTLVHALSGMIAPTSGSIAFDGRDITELPAEQRLRAGITLVPQGHRVFRSLTVEENLAVAARAVPDGWSVEEVLERFPVLHARGDQLAGSLSGGEQQMVAIGRALVGNGRLILMDEPSEGLDPQRVASLVSLLEEITRRGSSVLLVEQRVAFALKVADRVSFMVRGDIAETLAVQSVRDEPTIVTRHLGLMTG